jgi:hypothetical protein
MPLTNYPNGISTRATSAANTAAGDNDLNCLDLFVDGTAVITGNLTVSTAGIINSYYPLIFPFSTSSALQVVSLPVPFAGSLDNVYVTTGSVSAVVASYTVRVGSAGSVAVATVSNTTASQGVQEALTTTAVTFGITNALVCTRSAQGTAGDTTLLCLVRKTA